MGAKLGSGGGPMAEINVTPLIDVVLVLLVVFMVITPMLQSGMPVDLPEATQATTVNDVGQHIVVSLNKQGQWYVQQDEVDEDTLLEYVNLELRAKAEAQAKLATGEDREPTAVLIKADASLEYGEVRKAIDQISSSGLTVLYLAATEEI